MLRKVLVGAILASAVTLFLMVVLWGPVVPSAFDAGFDFENFGIPLILFDPRASFVAWLVLMIIVSPFLQLLTATFAGCVTLVAELRDQNAA